MKRIILLFLPIIFLTGCFNYRDVNRVIFVTALGIDMDENNKPTLYVEAFRSMRASEETTGKESRLILKGTGNTVFEAIRNINTTSAFKLNYTQNKAVIFSEKAARYGLDHFLDVLFRDQEFLTRQYLYVSKLDLSELLEMELKEEMFLGIYLFDLSENKPHQTKIPYMRIDDFFVERKLGGKINGLNSISKPSNPFMDRIILNGLAIMEEDKMIGELNPDETFIYSMVKDNMRTGYVSVPNPDIEDNLITLEVLKSKVKTSIHYNGGPTVDVKKEISLRTSIAEIQESFTATRAKAKNLLERTAEEKLEKEILALYKKFKKEGIDIFNLERDIDIKYPNANINKDDLLDSIHLTIEVRVFVEGSSDVVDFY